MSSLIGSPQLTPAMDSGTTGLSNRAQLALFIGTPIVVGTGIYLYYHYYHKRDTKTNKNEVNKTDGKNIDETEKDIKVSLEMTKIIAKCLLIFYL